MSIIRAETHGSHRVIIFLISLVKYRLRIYNNSWADMILDRKGTLWLWRKGLFCFMNEFVNKIKDTIRKYNMLERGRHLCVAVSGGVDSMTLLTALYCLKDELSLKLSVCHVNHNL